MARSSGLVGDRLLGLGQPATRPLNRNSIGVSFLLLLVMILGSLYAAPNLFQPDPALQIRGLGEANAIDPEALERAVQAAREAGIGVIGSAIEGDSGVIRVTTDEAQLHARDVVAAALNTGAEPAYTVALNRASTTPQWLQDIGAKPMTLGLDLSGGVHFLL
ncbi:MAG: hypothetical protein ACKOBM_13340, partial [Gammaproteobacteria bacterium]